MSLTWRKIFFLAVSCVLCVNLFLYLYRKFELAIFSFFCDFEMAHIKLFNKIITRPKSMLDERREYL